MKLTVINSNSSGNAYLLQSSTGETLLIECGVHFSKIKRALNFNLTNVAAIVTHSHGDHACSIKDVLNAGIYVSASKETLEGKGALSHHRATVIEAGKSFNHLGFKIKPFAVNHDVPCFGFLINHAECGLTLFLTDTYYCDYIFPRLNNIIIECNHDEEIIETNGTPKFLRERVIQSHMNFKTCKGLLQANDLSKVNNIVLIHLSDNNSDAQLFHSEISKLTGKHVHVAEAGLVIENFNKEAI
jgi:phosphoribosyl 1,2-cyclic phosphodiesterase